MANTIARGILAAALFEFSDLRDALGIDVTEATESIRCAMDGPDVGQAPPAH